MAVLVLILFSLAKSSKGSYDSLSVRERVEWVKHASLYKIVSSRSSASAFLLFAKIQNRNFLFLFEKNLGARHQKNVEKIFMFWD